MCAAQPPTLRGKTIKQLNHEGTKPVICDGACGKTSKSRLAYLAWDSFLS